ncbi:MAG: hypothetical protein ACRENI_13075 [Gemmatimonadaceae bacterium]
MIQKIRSLSVAAGVAAFALGAPSAHAQQTYPQTLYWGSGLVDIPVAWIAPLTGDFALNYSGKSFETEPVEPKINYSDAINSQLTFSISFAGRVEAGVAAFSSAPEIGFFGRGLIVREDDFRGESWLSNWLIPSIAFGVRNLGDFQNIDRFGAGYQLLPPGTVAGNPNFLHVPDSVHRGFDTAPTFYGVATKDFSLAEIRPNWPDIGMSLTVGYGNGLFKDDGGLGDAYAENSMGGVFFGAKADFVPARNMTLSLMAENNAWDYNLGASLDYRGIRAGLYFTEILSGTAAADTLVPESYLYNYSKFAFTIGWQSNIFALLRGDFLQSRADALEARREQLLAEIAARQQRIAALELEINRYEAQNLLELEQRRAQAEAELREEREALRRLEERLERIERQQPPRL